MQLLKAWIGLSIFFSCGLPDIWSGEPEIRFNLLTLPSTRQADLRLAMPARLNYEHAQLRQCMLQLADHYQFSYWIDRRVDADKLITQITADGTLRECLIKLAQTCDAEVGLVENVVTIAKTNHLASMQYASVRLHNQLSIVQANNHQTASHASNKGPQAELRPLAWPLLTTPSELAELVNGNWKLGLVFNLPHDLMNAGKLQPCTVATQLTLLYGGFDQCAAGKNLSELRLLSMPTSGNWQSSYPASMLAADQIPLVKSTFTDARIEKLGTSWSVVGPTAAHLQLLQAANRSNAPSQRPNRSPRTANSPASENDPLSQQRFDISKETDKPIGAILKNLGDQLGLTLEWDVALPPSAQHTLVTIEANKSKLDDILSSLGTQARLSISRDGSKVIVRSNDE